MVRAAWHLRVTCADVVLFQVTGRGRRLWRVAASSKLSCLSTAAHLVAGYCEARLPLRSETLCQAHPGSAASAIKPQSFKKAGTRCVLPLMTL